jgi:thymidylate kinase
MPGRKASKPGRMDFDAESMNEVLRFIEQYVSMNWSVRPTFNDEFDQSATLLPTRMLAEMRVATSYLLTEPKKPIGKLVVVTGLSKAGKETQMSNPSGLDGVTPLVDWFQRRNYKVSTTRTSFDGVPGGLIAWFLGRTQETLAPTGTLDRDLAWILWSLERAGRSARAAEWLSLDERSVLVAKRWTESNLAYHSVWGVEASRILGLERNVLKPDYVLDLDASVESVRQREPPSTLFKVWSEEETRSIRDSLLGIPMTYPFGEFYSVDANRPPSEVNGRLLDILGGLFP